MSIKPVSGIYNSGSCNQSSFDNPCSRTKNTAGEHAADAPFVRLTRTAIKALANFSSSSFKTTIFTILYLSRINNVFAHCYYSYLAS